MASQYFAILTDYGTHAFAHALSQGQPVLLTQFAVGDGNGQPVTPTASATALVHQTHIAPVSAVSLDPRNNKQVIIELTIPENVGGFYIREMGVFDSQNKLIAYANCPESFKPTESSGSGKVQVLRMILKVESSSAVTLSIDNSVIFVTRQQMTPKTITATTQNGFDESGHSHEINKASTSQQGIVQLTNDTGLESEFLALTAKAGKKLAQLIATVQLALNNYIPLNKRSSAVNSNDENNVATSKAVKTAYDKGVEAKTAADNAQRSAEAANNNANGRVSKSGDTMTGNLSFKQGDWSGISLYNNDGYYLRLEGNNHANGSMLTAVYRKPNGENVAVVSLPKRDGTIAYVDDVVAKSGDSMRGSLTFTGATDNYYIANYSWRMPIKFLGDTFIGNEVTGIGFNNNGALNLGGRKNSHEFLATIDSDGIYTGGVMRATSHTAKAYGQGAFANQWADKTAPYVVNNPNANGQNIYYPFIKGFNTNGNLYGTAFSFGYMTPGKINQFGSGAIHLITDSGNGKIWWFGHDGALRGDDFVTTDGKRLSDLPKERLIWQGSTDNQITVNAEVSKGVLFVLMDTPHGSNANRPIWFSAPIEQCHDTRIGEYDTGGTNGDYNFVTLALLHRNANNITITPQSDGRKPRLKKVVVFG